MSKTFPRDRGEAQTLLELAADLGDPIPFDCCIGDGDEALLQVWLERVLPKVEKLIKEKQDE